MSKQTKRPAKAGNRATAAQIGAQMNKATASLKSKIKEAKAAAKEQKTAPYGKDFFVSRDGKFIHPTGKYWSSTAKWENDPKAVGLSEGWLFVTGARIGSPRIQRLPHLWTQCRRANPKGLPYIAPTQPKTFKVVEREKVNLKVNRPSNSTLKYRLGDVWDAVEALNG
tara:strand:+ start:200 stop:703 length:504 start_codon:yes stop_codon:yes gene_type:complete